MYIATALCCYELTTNVTERIDIDVRIKPYHTPTATFRQSMTAQHDNDNDNKPEVTCPRQSRQQKDIIHRREV